MWTGEPAAHIRTIFAPALIAIALWLTPHSASAQLLRNGLFGHHSTDGRDFVAPPVARYVSEDGDVFVVDRSQGRPLLKFDSSPEVWVLQAQPAPRGDVIYKNELGETVLRATRLGGVTVFTPHRPDGEAAALAGPAAPLRLAPVGPQELIERLAVASARASRAAHRLIQFQGELGNETTPEAAGLMADTAAVTSLAIARLAAQPAHRRTLNGLQRVLLVVGRRPSVQMQKETLQIVIAPKQGLAGRPSSERIIDIATGR